MAQSELLLSGSPPSSASALDELKSGDRLHCSTRTHHFAGELLLVDRRQGIFVLRERRANERRCNIHFVRFAELQSFRKLSSPPPNFDGKCRVPMDSPTTARQRLAKAEQRLSRLWVDTNPSEAAKRTFIELKRIFDDVIWQGEDIKVLKCVLVGEPFDENCVRCLDSRASSIGTSARVKKILARRSSSSASSSICCLSSPGVVPPPSHCVAAVSPSSSTPSTLVQPDDDEEGTETADWHSNDNNNDTNVGTPVADLFPPDASSAQSEAPKALSRIVLSLRSSSSSQCFSSSSDELEMVTPPMVD